MERGRHPNVIRTWALNRTSAHGRPIQPVRSPNMNREKAYSSPRGAPHPSHKP
jgi:hypothetical protein